ncbi:MAG: substrate-binding domain-containing protein [Rhodospirillales bacterium]
MSIMRGSIAGILTCLGLTSLLSTAAPARAETIVIGGTGGALGTMQVMANAYRVGNRSDSIHILPSIGSGGGIKAVASRKIDLGLISRPLEKKEKRPGIREIPYGTSALVFVTHAHTDISNVSMGHVLDIYSGTVRQWPSGTPIRLILRPLSDGDLPVLLRALPGFEIIYKKVLTVPGIPILYTDQENAKMIERTSGVIGFTSLPLALSEKYKIKVLSFNGVRADPTTIADKSYPLVKTFRFIVGKQPGGAVAKFLDFVFSADGADILKKTGHLPLRRSQVN